MKRKNETTITGDRIDVVFNKILLLLLLKEVDDLTRREKKNKLNKTKKVFKNSKTFLLYFNIY